MTKNINSIGRIHALKNWSGLKMKELAIYEAGKETHNIAKLSRGRKEKERML